MADTPLETLTYTLTPADALAYETLPRERTGWRSAVRLVWLGGCGGLVAFVPADWTGPEWGWRFWLIALLFVGIAYIAALLAMRLAAEARAHHRIAAPVEVTLKQWDDHLAVRLGGISSIIAYEAIAGVSIGREHVFVVAPPLVLIVPRLAFADPLQMRAFGEEIDRKSRESVP